MFSELQVYISQFWLHLSQVYISQLWEKKSELWDEKSQLPFLFFYSVEDTGFHRNIPSFLIKISYYKDNFFRIRYNKMSELVFFVKYTKICHITEIKWFANAISCAMCSNNALNNLHTTRGQTHHLPSSRVVFEERVRELHWHSFLIVWVFVLRNSVENSSSIGGWKKESTLKSKLYISVDVNA